MQFQPGDIVAITGKVYHNLKDRSTGTIVRPITEGHYAGGYEVLGISRYEGYPLHQSLFEAELSLLSRDDGDIVGDEEF